ncbi:MAG TPA: hypothetical protein VG963_04850 [Polyangiaceae bacterium]|nr:hypothetical protein [Polyangiaceae bacterium]
MKPVEVSLYVGRGVAVPAPAEVTRAFRSAEITQGEQSPSGFQITFQASRSPSALDFDVFESPWLLPYNRIIVSISVDGESYVLMDGLITRRDFTPPNGRDPATLTVTGDDVSAAMDLEQLSIPWPLLPDFLIVEAILAKYLVYGLAPLALPTAISESNAPDEIACQQLGTDRSFIQQLAARYGYIFQVDPGPVAGTNIAYWGPPVRVGMPNATLNVETLLSRNVASLSFSYDATAPTTVVGEVQDAEGLDEPVPIAALFSLRLPPMASEPAILANVPYVRSELFLQSQMDPIQALAEAQGTVDRSTDKVLTARGELNVLRYGKPLVCPGLVALRGAGYAHDGLYYVDSVTHHLSTESFTQSFTLAREGLGSTLPVVPG